MRIALAAEGTRGDIHPMLALGDALRAAGHEVRLCGPPDFAGVASDRGLDFWRVGRDVRSYLQANAASLTRGSVAALRESMRYLRTSIALQFGALPEATRGCDLIVGAGVQGAASTAAELHDIPYRYVAYCPAMLPSREHAPVFLPFQALPPWANRLAWRTTFPIFAAGLARLANRQRRRLGLAPAPDSVRYFMSERPVLAADRELAPCPSDVPFAVDQIPCLHPFRAEPLPEKVEAFLEQGPAPVYLGFGSMPDAQPGATTQEILRALGSLGCRAIVSQGWAGLGEGALPEGVLAVGPVSHAALFPHCAAIVHHGGAGTTTTAARAGVPQVVVPHVLDQFYWARRVVLLGLGPPPVPRKGLTAAGLAAALTVSLDNEILAERARELGQRLRDQAARENVAARLLEGL